MFSQEKRGITGWWIFGIVMALITIAVFVLFAAGLNPFVKNIETSTTRQTQQYRTSSETMLLNNMEAWQKIDVDAAKYERDPANAKVVQGLRSQQATLLLLLRKQADRVPNSVPGEVKNFLSAHSSY